MTQTEVLITTHKAAQILGVSHQTVQRFVTAGLLEPALKAPGKRGAFFFTVEEVNRLRTARQAQKSKAGR